MKIAFGTKLIFIKRHHGTSEREGGRGRERERENARAGERWSHSIDYSRNERTQRRINVSKDPTGRAHVCGCIWRICGRARPETVVIPVLIRLPVKLLPGDRHFVACQPCSAFIRPARQSQRDETALLPLLSFCNTRVSQKYI